MRIASKLAAACAVVALVMAFIAGDPQGLFSGDDGDDVAVTCDLSAVLPATRGEPAVTLSQCGAVFVDERAPAGHAPELEIFRPPQRRA